MCSSNDCYRSHCKHQDLSVVWCGVVNVPLIFSYKEVTVLPVMDGLIIYCQIIVSVLFLIHGKMQVDDQYWGDRMAS
jgi:hypothetical protein